MPRIVDHDQRRTELVAAAFGSFDRRGYGAVSMRDLAADLRVSTGTLYHYFSGKDAIFEAVVRARFEADLAAVNAVLGKDVSPVEQLGRIAEWVSHNTDRLRATLRLVLDYARQQPTVPAWVGEVLGGYEGPLRQALGPDLARPAVDLLLGGLVRGVLTPELPAEDGGTVAGLLRFMADSSR